MRRWWYCPLAALLLFAEPGKLVTVVQSRWSVSVDTTGFSLPLATTGPGHVIFCQTTSPALLTGAMGAFRSDNGEAHWAMGTTDKVTATFSQTVKLARLSCAEIAGAWVDGLGKPALVRPNASVIKPSP